MILEINGIEVECIIGELPYERKTPQKLLVDLKLTIADDAAHTDRLEDTVDYAALADKVRAALVEAKCRMIERAAYLTAQTSLLCNNVLAVEARVVKSGAVRGIASASATVKIAK